MKTLSDLKELLSLHYKSLSRLEQKLVDTVCEHEKDYIIGKILQVNHQTCSLEEKIKLLESEE